jgi:hypothetical protein
MAGFPERYHQRMRLEHGMDYAAQHTGAFAVNYPDLFESLLGGSFQVVVQKVFHLVWPEGMKVDRVFDWILDYFVFFHFSTPVSSADLGPIRLPDRDRVPLFYTKAIFKTEGKRSAGQEYCGNLGRILF